jgi:hypothetical protein
MRRIAAVLLSAIFAAPVLAAMGAAAPAETCTSYLTAQREKMLEAAMACEGTPTQVQSARSQADAERQGQKLMPFAQCSQPISINKSDDLFRECVRTHLCAAQTYSCAIGHTTARSTVQECGQATTTCKVTDPIPQ